MSSVEIGKGDGRIVQKWIPVVPDQFLSKDINVLLGCDILKNAPIVWDGAISTSSWRETRYVMSFTQTTSGRASPEIVQ